MPFSYSPVAAVGDQKLQHQHQDGQANKPLKIAIVFGKNALFQLSLIHFINPRFQCFSYAFTAGVQVEILPSSGFGNLLQDRLVQAAHDGVTRLVPLISFSAILTGGNKTAGFGPHSNCKYQQAVFVGFPGAGGGVFLVILTVCYYD